MKLEWRCRSCKKLLGKTDGVWLHLQFARKHQYLVSLPSKTMCPSCGQFNMLSKADFEARPLDAVVSGKQ